MHTELYDRLAAVPNPEVPVPPAVHDAIAASVRYLASDAAEASLAADTYWPKWDSPWWHMVLLFELGEARQIPERAVRAMVGKLDAMPVKLLPMVESDIPPGVDPFHTSCHCALGCMTQVLVARGVDVDRVLPWVKPWFLRYQMADGGLSCDSSAYLVEGECPSSMVGTVPSLEAMLLGDPAAFSVEQNTFLDRAAGFLLGRELRIGSSSVANAVERTREPAWLQPCFPRFYLYDVVRGLSVLVRQAELRDRTLPSRAIARVVTHLVDRFPDGVVRLERRATDDIASWSPDESRTWTAGPASRFPLLEVTSVVGEPSPWVTRQWAETRGGLTRLLAAGRITG